MPGLWYEITAQVPRPLTEIVAELMREAAPGGLAVEEPVDLLGPEEGYAVRIGEPIAMRAYLPASELGAVLTQRLRDALAPYPDVELTAKPLYDEDWSVSWREFFGPVLVGRIAIVPTWVEYEASPDQLVIRIDPGQAFGTGHHETTRLCLAALDQALAPGTRVLEVGAGSGILSIAAARLGAASVEAFEIDPIAADVGRANCEANDVAGRVAITSSAFAGAAAAAADLAIANVSARTDIELAEQLAASVTEGGRLIVSGFLTSDRAEVLAAYQAPGLELVNEREENEWMLLEFARPSGA